MKLESRICRVCKKTKKLTCFSKRLSSPSGYSYECKLCHNKRVRNFYKRLKKDGFCAKCGVNPPEPELKFCRSCLNKSKIFYSNTREWKKEKKECTRCSNPSEPNSTLCTKCKRLEVAKSRKQAIKFTKKIGDYFGNKCAICGLESLHTEMYDCHHKFPNEKVYQISELSTRSWDNVIEPEIIKCVYLCKNCHARLHAGRFDDQIASGELVLTPGKVKKEVNR